MGKRVLNGLLLIVALMLMLPTGPAQAATSISESSLPQIFGLSLYPGEPAVYEIQATTHEKITIKFSDATSNISLRITECMCQEGNNIVSLSNNVQNSSRTYELGKGLFRFEIATISSAGAPAPVTSVKFAVSREVIVTADPSPKTSTSPKASNSANPVSSPNTTQQNITRISETALPQQVGISLSVGHNVVYEIMITKKEKITLSFGDSSNNASVRMAYGMCDTTNCPVTTVDNVQTRNLTIDVQPGTFSMEFNIVPVTGKDSQTTTMQMAVARNQTVLPSATPTNEITSTPSSTPSSTATKSPTQSSTQKPESQVTPTPDVSAPIAVATQSPSVSNSPIPESTSVPTPQTISHVQQDVSGVENGGIALLGVPLQPQVIGEDGIITPAAPLPDSGEPLPPDAITVTETFKGQPGGTLFNSPDIATPVELIAVALPSIVQKLPGLSTGIQAANRAFVSLENIGNDMSPITRKKAKKILVTTIIAGQMTTIRRKTL
ncbi:MAG: hypothetical protein F2787_01725 [Actinobacteria bacterium]|nr:hypothetical protein [Actinomycetota bacterium]MSX24473.1 hypothetical protein [Actinomycetota bacterium]MSY45972.1 hypothetical protein [Actinomycetota bacterium]MTB00157.1 hypothetical protein [Actinomycetota bacterium]